MPYIVPNATDVGSIYNDLNQAEPDALDFQILGDRSTGVLIGGLVKALDPSSTSVSVTEGYVALKGVVYPLYKSGALVTINTTVALPSIVSNNKRFDLVVARLTNSNMELTVLTGQESETNPTYPASPSRLSVIPPVATQYFNPETDVILAAVFRNGINLVTNAHVVDKRVNVLSTTMIRGTRIPANVFGNDGDFYYRLPTSGNESSIWIKREGVWSEVVLGGASAYVTPVGAIIAWPSPTNPNTEYWKECNGQVLLKADYAELYALLGSTYGVETPTAFSLPDFRSKFLRGSENVGVSGGADSVTLTTNNLPAHTHFIGDHVHGIGNHTHNVSITNNTVITSSAGTHQHFGDSEGRGNVVLAGGSMSGGTFYVAPLSHEPNPGYAAGVHYNYSGGGVGGSTTPGPGLIVRRASSTAPYNNDDDRTGPAGEHNHTIVLSLVGVADASTESNTTVSATTNTGSTGSGNPLAVVPAYVGMRWFIRAK